MKQRVVWAAGFVAREKSSLSLVIVAQAEQCQHLIMRRNLTGISNPPSSPEETGAGGGSLLSSMPLLGPRSALRQYDRMERINKGCRGHRRGHFACLGLCLYGIRELACVSNTMIPPNRVALFGSRA